MKENKKVNICTDLISEYSANTTIHGVSYFSDNKRTYIERLFWLIGFLFSLAVCIYLIAKTWIKYKENPVIVSFAQEHTPVWEIPFPAVTICPLNKINQNIFNYTQIYTILILNLISDSVQDKMTSKEKLEESIKKFMDISLICNLDNLKWPKDNFTDERVITLIKELAPKMEETFNEVIWQSEKYILQPHLNPEKFLFHEQVTSEGLCFTFNAFGHSDMYTDQMKPGVQLINHNKKNTGWSIEEGYSDNNYEKTYPERTSYAGLVFGLNTNLIINTHQRDGYCGDGVAGFKILLHNPTEIPRLTEQYFLAPAKQQVTIAVTPKLIRTSKNLLNISPNIRNCYFAHERQLRFYKIYTQYNCKTECEANITRQYCGCLPFYLPRDSETIICAYGKVDCLNEVQNQVFKYENMLKNHAIAINETQQKELYIYQQCNCLPSCNSLEYEVELSQAEYLYQISRRSHIQHVNSSLIEITPINIFFKESQFLALDRSELYGQTDFIANIGGLLGLFLGFSFLSFLEMIYFLTLRMWCKLYNLRKIIKTTRINIAPAPKIITQPSTNVEVGVWIH